MIQGICDDHVGCQMCLTFPAGYEQTMAPEMKSSNCLSDVTVFRVHSTVTASGFTSRSTRITRISHGVFMPLC